MRLEESLASLQLTSDPPGARIYINGDARGVTPAQIDRIVRRVEGVADCHEIRTRGNVHAVYIDLHVLVEPKMTVEASHHLANVIERDLKKELPGVTDVVVHIEPTTHDHSPLSGV